jgi:thiamine-phosphate pyrophosphorylase
MSPDTHTQASCQLYLISPPQLVLDDFAIQLEEALSAGEVGAFQLRLKHANQGDIEASIARLMPICHAHEVAFILNDCAHTAKAYGCDGVHLGQEDMPLAEARALLGDDVVIGVSCHDSMHMAMEAGEGDADYVAFGAFHPTKSKEPEKLAKYGTPTAELLSWWQQNTLVPCVAIGGMTPENCEPLVAAGADFIAAITAVWENPDGAAEAVQAFNSAMLRGILAREAMA